MGKKIIIIPILLIGLMSTTRIVSAKSSQAPLRLDIISNQRLSGTAGDYVTVKAKVRNISSQPINNITTYLSLADEGTKLPVDLEDWSAEKGLFIGYIGPGQTLPLDWKIHFVKSGHYSLIIVAEITGQTNPQTSSIVHFSVSPKRNLNPGQVLPVALLTPVIVLAAMFLVSYKRNSRLDQ